MIFILSDRRCRKSAVFLCGVLSFLIWQSSVYPAQAKMLQSIIPSGNEEKQISLNITGRDNKKPNTQANQELLLSNIKVQPGDTLWKLAQKYSTTVEEIVALNNIARPDLIKVGQTLVICNNESILAGSASAPQISQADSKQSKGLSGLLNYVEKKLSSFSVTSVKEVMGSKVSNTKGSAAAQAITIEYQQLDQGKQTKAQPKPAVQKSITTTVSRGRSKTISKEDMDLLAHIIYAEARGESLEGQVAVAAVVLNRLESEKFPKTIHDVIYQPGAFTAVADNQIKLTPNEMAYQAAQEALNGYDPTGGALFYYNPRTATDHWIKGRPVVKTIGNHAFSI